MSRCWPEKCGLLATRTRTRTPLPFSGDAVVSSVQGTTQGVRKQRRFAPLSDHPPRYYVPSRPDLLDPHTLSQLGGVELIARQVVEGFIMGLHRSPHRGFSAEFAELRAYPPGDEMPQIEWPISGRSER